jgi:molybdate-binding protein
MRFVPRQKESGTYALFEHLARVDSVDTAQMTFKDAARSEADAVMAVHARTADATFGLEALAAPYGLAFVPLIEERFDLLVDRKAWFDTPMQQFLGFLRSEAFKAHAATLAGYDLSDLGVVRWNA